MRNEPYVCDDSRALVGSRIPAGLTSLRVFTFSLAVLLGAAAVDQSKADSDFAPEGTKRSDASAQRAPFHGVETESVAAEQLQALEREQSKANALRRELASARTELLLKLCKDVDATNAIGKRQPATEEQQQKADGLARDLAPAQRERECLTTEADATRNAAEASLTAATRQALEEERRKAGLLERDLAAARQSIEALETNARLAATTQAGAVQGRQLAEAAAKQAGEALERERERANTLANDLETARRERDTAQLELRRVSAASKHSLDEERAKAVALTRDLASARKAIDTLRRRAGTSRSVTKASAIAGISRSPTQRRSELPKTITLPEALRPTRPPAGASLE
jgi:hypothetical protein